MVRSPDSSSDPPKKPKFPIVPWYFLTRAIGALVLLFGVFGDATADRGTLILTGAGLMGIDKVARSEPPSK